MTILHVTSSSGHKISGAEVYLIRLGRELLKRGHRVLVSPFEGRRFGEDLRRQGFEVHPVRISLKLDPRGLRTLIGLCKAEKVDLVHTHLSTSSVNGAGAARLTGIPSVATVHGMNRKWSFMLAEHLIAVSQAVCENLVRQGVAPGRITVVHNGVDQAELLGRRLPQAQARARLGLAESGPVLATVATLVPAKGHECALRAVAALTPRWPTLRYLVIGDGPHRPALGESARNLGIADHVLFLGAREDVPEVLSAADVFVFPSLKEALPLALLEAMALGLPVAASKVGGIPEAVTNETGLLVPPNDSEALAAAVESLLIDPPRTRRLGDAGRRRVAEVFDINRMTEAVLRVYERLVGAKAGGNGSGVTTKVQ